MTDPGALPEGPGLARFHHPLTGRFPAPHDRSARRRWSLGPQRLAEFEERGLVAGLPVLTPTETAELRGRLDAIGRRIHALEPVLYEVEAAWLERPDEVVLHFLGAWLVDELLHDLVFHPAVTVPVAEALGTRRLRFWHDQVFWKPARHPAVVPWHQDYSYWTRTGPPAHATMFISLDDMGPENGGLEYVPGSHRWGLFPPQPFGGELDAILPHLSDEQRAAFRPEPVVLRAGEASIHHSHLVHGSRANPSDRPRRGAVLNYMADGTLVTDDREPLLRGVEPIPAGRPVAGPHFPITLDFDA